MPFDTLHRLVFLDDDARKATVLRYIKAVLFRPGAHFPTVFAAGCCACAGPL
jgi:hypothetical protein